MDKSTAIALMNSLGQQKKPFLFLVDFALEDIIIFQLPSPSTDILFNFDGFCNYTPPVNPLPPFDFRRFPISFQLYKERFDAVKAEIAKGNTYLINLTCETPVQTNLTLDQVFLYSQARFKLLFRNRFVVFSPEIFIRIRDNRIYSYPMKGTIDAGIENAEEKILADLKETAEHYTIVDLIRNDLSMVAHNVAVTRFRYIERIKTHANELLQVSSEIRGDLDSNYARRLGDILFRLLPAGSICGAPKQRTIEIITRTESYSRGFYTGVFGYFDGRDLTSSVMIRFIEKVGDQFIYRSGGGITSFSEARSEYGEMIDKVYVPLF
jgi:para-aminobenzoate synthetase component I